MIFPTFTMHICTVHYDTDTHLHQVQYIYVFVVRRYSDVSIYRYRQCTALTECPWFLGGIGICFPLSECSWRYVRQIIQSSFNVLVHGFPCFHDFLSGFPQDEAHKWVWNRAFLREPVNLVHVDIHFHVFVKKSKTKLSSFSPALYGILETLRFVYVCTVQDYMIL